MRSYRRKYSYQVERAAACDDALSLVRRRSETAATTASGSRHWRHANMNQDLPLALQRQQSLAGLLFSAAGRKSCFHRGHGQKKSGPESIPDRVFEKLLDFSNGRDRDLRDHHRDDRHGLHRDHHRRHRHGSRRRRHHHRRRLRAAPSGALRSRSAHGH